MQVEWDRVFGDTSTPIGLHWAVEGMQAVKSGDQPSNHLESVVFNGSDPKDQRPRMAPSRMSSPYRH